MQYASRSKRIAAYWIDFLLLLSSFYAVGRILWSVIPESEVVYGSMISYRASDWKVYTWTVIISILIVVCYHCLLPLTRLRTTIGGRIQGIQIVRLDGSPLGIKEAFRRLGVLLMRASLVLVLGPVLASITDNGAAALFGLFVGVCFLIASALAAFERPEGAWLWENIGGYRLISGAKEIEE